MHNSRNLQNHEQYGDWQKLSVLGSGGFGQVSLWENVLTKEKIAIKMCKQQLQEKHLQRWQQEVEIMKNMNHPSIVSFRDVPADIQKKYVVSYVALGMEYCELGDLRRMLGQAQNCCGLAENQVRDVLSDIGSAIKFLHSRKIVHRDLKPENIVIKRTSDNKLQYKIIDLGYAKDLSGQSYGTSFVGTLHYLAPEFFETQDLRYTATVDFWSFGLVAFECITGRRPFLEAMRTLLSGRKRDEHICIVDDGSPTPQFLSTLPKPHALNDVFAKKMEVWLQQMLRYDPNRRGDGGGDGWFIQLEQILKEKHVQVFNANSCSIITVPVERNMSINNFQEVLYQKSNVMPAYQLLLFQNGTKPDPRKSIINQPWQANGEWMIYFFSKQEDHTVPVPTPCLPNDVAGLIAEPRVQLHTKQTRRVLCLATNFVCSQCKLCQQALGALCAVANSIEKHNKYFCNRRDELNKSYYSFMGTLSFFDECLTTDISQYEAHERAGVFRNEALIDEWIQGRDEVNEYRSSTLQNAKSIITSADKLSHVASVRERAKDCIDKEKPKLADKIKVSYQMYDSMRVAIRRFGESEHHVMTESTQPPEEKGVHSRMRELALNFVHPALDLVERVLKETTEHIRGLVALQTDLSEIVPKIVDILEKIEENVGNLRQYQAQRQDNLWEIIRLIKGEAEEINECFVEICQTTMGCNLVEDPDIPQATELTNEMLQQRSMFSRIVDDLREDGEISDINALDWEYLQLDEPRDSSSVVTSSTVRVATESSVGTANSNFNNNAIQQQSDHAGEFSVEISPDETTP